MADNTANQDPARSTGAGTQNPADVPASPLSVEAAPVGGDASDTAIPTLTRFRLPRFFSHAPEAPPEEVSGDITVGELPDDPIKNARPAAVPVTAIGKALAAHSSHKNGHTHQPATPVQDEDTVALSASDFSALVEQIAGLTDQIREVNERESGMERVFNTLHSELADYKNDFLYEHLKPVVRPLLFLFDSLEQFDGEVAMTESAANEAVPPVETAGVLSASVVRENVTYFRDQLVEALHVCEVVLMDPPSGNFNSKLHKAVDIVPVPQEEDGKIVRVVRAGWYLNGQLLRPAEVVIGKFRPQT